MGYRLGVDLGTTFTAAAVRRGDRAEVFPLGDHGAEIPSVVFLREDGELAVGEGAERRGLAAPHRLAREFKRRIGDPVPLLLAGSPYSPHALTGVLLREVVRRVTEREGAPPDAVTVTHPANWGPYKLDLLRHAVDLADLPGALTCSEPEAAALRYAELQRLAVDDVVAVYDLGGGTFDAAVLTRTADGFAVLGQPAGVEQLGGVDFDDAVFTHVLAQLGPAVEDADLDDPATATAVGRLRRDCVAAKEALSQDTDIAVPVGLPGLHTSVRLTRAEFEDLIRPALAETVTSLRRALRSADVEPDRLAAVLLAGGSSRIPLVSEVLSAELGRPIAVDAHPKHIVALGASSYGAPAPPLEEQRAEPGSVQVPQQPRRTGSEPPRRREELEQQAPARDADAPGQPGPSRSVEEPARRATRVRPLPAATAGLAAATLALTALGGLLGPSSGGLRTGLLTVAGEDAAAGPLPREGVVGGEADRSRLDLELGGVPVASFEVVPDDRLELQWPSLLVGRVTADIATTSPDSSGTATIEPVRSLSERLVSVPGAALLVTLLFALAYGESLLKPVRRGRRAGPVVLLGAAAVGGVLGLTTAVAGWLLALHALPLVVAVGCVLTGALTGVGLALLLQERAARRAAARPAARSGSRRL